MNGKQMVLCAVLATVGAVSSAAAAPAWCKAPDAGSMRLFKVDGALSATDPTDALHDLVGVICEPDDEATAKMGELEAMRKRWSAALGMIDEDWKDARVWAGADQSTRASHEIWLEDRGMRDGVMGRIKIAWSALSAIDQFGVMAKGLGNDMETDSGDAGYVADALGDRLTEPGRLGYLLRTCAKPDLTPVVIATCEGDVAALDRKKLARELRADRSYSGLERTIIRLALYRWDRGLPAYRAQVKKWTARDEAYGKMFAIAAAQHAEWTTRRTTEAALLKLAMEMEDANATSSRKAFAGCEDRTWAALKTAISGIPAAAFTGLPDEPGNPFAANAASVIVSVPAGYLAARAYTYCVQGGGLSGTLGAAMNRWPGHRGPRTGTASAILMAGLELDDATATIDYPSWSRHTSGAYAGAIVGELAKLERDGERVTLHWKKTAEKVPQCQASKKTHRITRIHDDGTLVYESLCLKWAMVSTDRTPPTVTVPAHHAEGLKVGMTVRAAKDVVFAAYVKGSKTPVVIAGASVK